MSDVLLALGFVEDWARQVSIDLPSPPGVEAAGRLVAAILPTFGAYGVRELRKRVLDVVLKIPRHVPGFLDLAARARGDRDGDDPIARDLGELLVSTIGSAMVSRDFPGVVIDQLRARVMMRNADAAVYHAAPSEVNECFGIRDSGLSDFFPASGLQGPFWALLRHHPRDVIPFIIELLNHAANWYGERRWPGNDLEPATRVTLDVPDGEPVAQWMNGRLYLLYRGESVGPYLLQSALMALEAALFDVADIATVDLEGWLLDILRASNNVMASAVVASVCVAHPTRAGRATLALLSCRALIECDRRRLVAERRTATEFLTGLNPSHEVHENERRRANARPHRREDLEMLAVRLQLTEGRDAVWSLIDRHRAAVPADTDDENDLIWRLTLHRMDVRHFRPVDTPPNANGLPEPAAGQVYYGPGDPEPPVQELVARREAELATLSRHLQLLNAAHVAWDRPDASEAADWRALLAQARAAADQDADAPEYLRGGVPVVAACCLRDRRAEMTDDERAWCAEQVARALYASESASNETDGTSFAFRSEPHLAAVIPVVAADHGVPLGTDRVELLAAALTHGADRVADHAYAGAALLLKPRYERFALRCAAAAVREAEARDEEQRAERAVGRFGTARPAGGAERVRAAVRRVLENDADAHAALGRLRFDTWAGRLGARRACGIFAQWPAWPASQAGFERVAAWLAETWAWDRRTSGHRDRDFGGEQDLARRLAHFALTRPPAVARAVCAPLVAQVECAPREVADFVHELVRGADAADAAGGDAFWALWQDFADATVAAPWASRLRRDDPYEQPLLDRLFLTAHWGDGVTHWRRLDGYADRVHALASRLPAVVACVEAYTRFLFTVGRRELPDAFRAVDALVQRADGGRVAAHRNTAYMLESLLAQFVYAEPLGLKSRPPLRDAVLRLLDALVAAGSSAAYRMRDDFVTPLRVEPASVRADDARA